MEMEEQTLLNVIEHYFNIQRYDQAVDLAIEGIREDPEDECLWYLLGYSNYFLDKFDEAEEQLLEALHLGYDEEDIYHLLGNVYLETERWKESEEMFLETLQLNPNNAITHASYAMLMQKTGKKEKAKRLIKKAFELDPENAVVLRAHYILLGVNESRKEQVLALEQYVNSDDSELDKLITLGVHEAYRNNIKEAREHFRQAFLLKPDNKELLRVLEDFEVASHPLLAPNRMMGKIGGPAVLWFIGAGVGLLLFFTGFEDAGLLWIQCYAVVALYTWLAEPLVKLIRKVRS